MTRWKFGVAQTAKEERDEIRAAKAAGRSEEYVNGQRCLRLIQGEAARKRAAKVERKATMAT